MAICGLTRSFTPGSPDIRVYIRHETNRSLFPGINNMMAVFYVFAQSLPEAAMSDGEPMIDGQFAIWR